MAEAIVNGVRLAYELHGQGKPVLFLPTDGMMKESWLAGPAPALAEAGYQAVLVDLRGCGGSDAPPPPYTVADLAADTAGLIEQLGLGRCRLVGYGLGGAVAEHLAAERADLVRAAALLGSVGPPTAFARFVEEAVLEADEVIDRFPRLQVAIGMFVLFTPAQLQDDAFVHRLTERMLERAPGAIPGLHAAGVAWLKQDQATRAARWAKISVPLLAVVFEQSLGSPPSNVRQFTQAIPGAELAVIPGAGGGGVFTHAAEISEVLLKFFAAD
jgi:pimeloyl-ACP methyl ester carboxylesterase